MNGNYWKSLERRRSDLGISFPALSERTGISVTTLKRIFSGTAKNPTLHSLQALARVLGVELRINGSMTVVSKRSVAEMREIAANEKAEQLVKLVQGTSALESQSVGPEVVRTMVAQTVRELLAGPNRKLWAS